MVDIIMPVFNNLTYTQKALWALEAHTTIPCHLIIVDNGSTDGTADYLWGLEKEMGLHIITNDANLGFAKAVNLGLVMSDSPYVIILNNDVEVGPGWLKTLIQAMEANPHIGAMGVLSTAKTQATWEGHFYPIGVKVIENYRLGQLPYSCVVLRREAIDVVGLLDEEFFLYGEDDDYNIRLIRAGWSLAIHTDITVKHEHGATSKTAGLEHYRKAAMERIMRKWGGKPKLVAILRVKDEEHNIRRCLDSMPFVDFFVIVDNGCSDNTMNIAGEMLSGRSVFLRTTGLDAARDYNEAYQVALRKGATHVLWLDADEEFEARAAEELPKLLVQDVAGWWFGLYPFVLSETHYRVDGPWRQFTQEGQLRLFQAQKGVYWASGRKAHAGLPCGVCGQMRRSGLRIKHWTVETPEEAERKIAFYEAADGKSYGHLRDGAEARYEEWVE